MLFRSEIHSVCHEVHDIGKYHCSLLFFPTLSTVKTELIILLQAIQKSTIAHRQVMELRKKTRQAIKEAEAKATELTQSQQRTADLEAEVTRLTGLVASADGDKQRAVTEVKDKYLWEMAQLETKKNAEITELKEKVEGASKEGFKEVEAGYTLQCEAAKELFFKCGWRSAVEKIGCGPETEVYNAPEYFIPASLQDYADDIQKQFLGSSDDEEDDEDESTDTPAVNDRPNEQSVRSEPVVEGLSEAQPTGADVLAVTGLPTQTVPPTSTGLRTDAVDDFDAEFEDLLR